MNTLLWGVFFAGIAMQCPLLFQLLRTLVSVRVQCFSAPLLLASLGAFLCLIFAAWRHDFLFCAGQIAALVCYYKLVYSNVHDEKNKILGKS